MAISKTPLSLARCGVKFGRRHVWSLLIYLREQRQLTGISDSPLLSEAWMSERQHRGKGAGLDACFGS